MKIEKKLDKIIDLLYDETSLHWKEIPATDFIVFSENKFGFKWSDAEMNLVLRILTDNNYIEMNNVDPNRIVPTYSLTSKGAEFKINGGFVWNKLKRIATNIIILWAAIFTIAISIYTIGNYISDYRTKNKINDNKTNQGHTEITVPPIRVDSIGRK
jgi:hypothetical protein